jgi:hypothetical protein
MAHSGGRAPAVLVAGLLLAGCAGAERKSVGVKVNRSASRSDPSAPRTVTELDATYETPIRSQLVADPAGEGIYYWGRSAKHYFDHSCR